MIGINIPFVGCMDNIKGNYIHRFPNRRARRSNESIGNNRGKDYFLQYIKMKFRQLRAIFHDKAVVRKAKLNKLIEANNN